MNVPQRLAVVLCLLGPAGAVGSAGAAGAIGVPDRMHYEAFPELEGRIVQRIVVLGNNRTQEIVFRREMLTEVGLPFRSQDLWRDWERIVDLGIFAEVEVEPVPTAGGVLVVVSVHERPWWLAAPVANYDLEDKTWSLGYRARARNLGGLNRTIRSNARFGNDDRFSVAWETPWLGESRRSLTAGVDVQLPRPNDEELRTSRVHLSSTRYFGDYRRTRTGVTLFSRLEVLERDGTHPNGAVHQLTPVLGLGWFRDERNVRIDPTRGTLASAAGELVTGWTQELGYGRTSLDARGFLSLRPGVVLATRAATTLTTGGVPDYRRLGVGGDNSIRGQPSDIETGNNTARASVEVRFPLLSQRRFALPIPFLPGRISNVDFRVDGEFFVDAGTAWNGAPDFPEARVRGGAGFGLRIFLPILELARFEVAFDQDGRARIYLSEGNVI